MCKLRQTMIVMIDKMRYMYVERLSGMCIEYKSDDVIKMKFVKLRDLLRYSERTTSKTPTRQKLAIRGQLFLRYYPSYAVTIPYKSF